jgi:riboflavin synthase
MFTGIVEEVGKVVLSQSGRLVVEADRVVNGLTLGASMAVNGVCLTINGLSTNSFSVDVMPETARRSNIGQLKGGDRVNLERPLVLNGWVGGHLVQGHIDAIGRVKEITPEGHALTVRFEAPRNILYYVVEKGFIAVDGISLTVVGRDDMSFQVSVVDFTRRNTILNDRRVGDIVNLEVDIIAKYVAQFTHAKSSGIDIDFLQEHGFGVN